MEKQTTNKIVSNSLFTAAEYAQLHNVNQKTVYDWIKTDKLPVQVYQFKNRTYKLIDPYYPAPKTYRKPKTQTL